jgi:hypothetical protein
VTQVPEYLFATFLIERKKIKSSLTTYKFPPECGVMILPLTVPFSYASSVKTVAHCGGLYLPPISQDNYTGCRQECDGEESHCKMLGGYKYHPALL